MANAKLYVLDLGMHYMYKGFHLGFKDLFETEEGGHVIQYIDHPEGKILWDVGWELSKCPIVGKFPQKPEGYVQGPEQTLEAQLKKIGVGLDDIDYVVMSHLMDDHAANLPLFHNKKAKIIVQREELKYAYYPEPFHTWMYSRKNFDEPNLNWKLIEGPYKIVEGFEVIPAPGHTPGYQYGILRLKNTGTVGLVGCEIAENFYGRGLYATQDMIPPGVCYNAAEALKSMRRFLTIIESERGQIFYRHDYPQFKKLRKPPEYYD